MKPRRLHRKHQCGAALMMVLLLVATLSFIILALADRMTQSIQRTAGESARSELLWRIMSLETFAVAVVREAEAQSQEAGVRFTPDHPLFANEIDLPLPNGGGALWFADATRCFNLNSLVQNQGAGGTLNEDAVEEFVELGKAIGLGENEAENIAHVAADWIDGDSVQQIGGAEDGLYMGLPTPFRTGSTLLASVSELRAMDGVTAELYAALKPYLCAHPTSEPSQINVNMLGPRDAPILAGLTRGAVSRVAAEEVIAARPPGGWDSIDAFWAHNALSDAQFTPEFKQSRTAITSRYLEVRGRGSVNEIDIAVRLFLRSSTADGDILLISREIGAVS